ncbi:hypothetical protein GCM10010343_12030 [Streptomyces avidinii]|nr:transposase [Streptomyces avidinii]GGY88477.1 hypothetical protein GCM10010343_12030 [Streptomyces avidinii]
MSGPHARQQEAPHPPRPGPYPAPPFSARDEVPNSRACTAHSHHTPRPRQLVTRAKDHLRLTIKTVSRPKDATGFVVLPRRWVVERTLAWLMHARRHARDYERLVQHSEALITWAVITLMTRRIAQRKGLSRPPLTPLQLGQAA